jgi:hypothetical protein
MLIDFTVIFIELPDSILPGNKQAHLDIISGILSLESSLDNTMQPFFVEAFLETLIEKDIYFHSAHHSTGIRYRQLFLGIKGANINLSLQVAYINPFVVLSQCNAG